MTEERKKISCTGCAAWTTLISVALNLFLVGVLVGPLLGPDQGDRLSLDQGQIGRTHRPPREPGFMLEHVARELPPQDADKVRTIFAQERKAFQGQHTTMREEMQKLSVILKQEKPDVEALRKIMDEIHAFGEGMHLGMNRALERVATEVSFEGRQKIAEAMEKGPLREGPRRMPPPDRGEGGAPDEEPNEDAPPPPPLPAMQEASPVQPAPDAPSAPPSQP